MLWKLDPKRIESYLSLARFYVVTKDNAKAEETFRRALSINNNSGLAHTEFGKFLVQTGRSDEGHAELQKAVEVEPTNRNSHHTLGSFYLVNKQFDKAEIEYKAIAELDKNRPEGAAILGDFYATTNRLDEAASIYQGILTKSPDFAIGRFRLGEILLQKGDTAGANAQIDELLKKDKTDRQALLLRARVLLKSGQGDDIKAAIEGLKEVLRQEPNSQLGLYFMAQANLALGLIDQGRSFARLGAELSRLSSRETHANPDQSDYWRCKGNCPERD